MAKTLRMAENLLVRTGTSKPVYFDMKKVGVYGRKKRGDSTVFVWVQTPLLFLSNETHDAYAMSQPLIDELDSLEIDKVFLTHSEQLIPFDDIKNGDVISQDHEIFHENRDFDQRYVLVERTNEKFL